MCYAHPKNDILIKKNDLNREENFQYAEIYSINNQEMYIEEIEPKDENEVIHIFLVSLYLAIFYYLLFRIINYIKQ